MKRIEWERRSGRRILSVARCFFGELSMDEARAWLQLLDTPGIGRESARALLARFGSAQALPAAIDAVYRIELNEFQGASTLQLVVEHVSE